MRKYQNEKTFKKDLIIFFLFLAIYFFLSLKNFINIKIFSPSSNGGANLIQRTLHSIGNDSYYDLINKSKKIPKWFKFCNNEIFKQNSNISKSNKDYFQSKLAHGQCFMNSKGQVDLLRYKNQLIKKNFSSELINIIDQDLKNRNNKIWLFSGIHDDLSYAITSQYTSYGNVIFFDAIKHYPYQMLIGEKGNKGVFLTFLKMISYGGMFPEYYEEIYLPTRNKYSIMIYKFCIFFILFFNLFTPYVFYKKIKYAIKIKKIKNLDFIYFLFLFILIFQTIIISTATCCENPRIAVVYFPIILLITLINIKSLLNNFL